MNKDRQIVSELHNFFTESGCRLGVQRIMNVLGTINITERQMAFEKKPNCKFTCAQVIQMMILFPFFSVKNAATMSALACSCSLDCHKSMFYRFSRMTELTASHTSLCQQEGCPASSVRSDPDHSRISVCSEFGLDTTFLRQALIRLRCLTRYSQIAGREASLVTRTLLCPSMGSHQLLLDLTLQEKKVDASSPRAFSKKDIMHADNMEGMPNPRWRSARLSTSRTKSAI